MPSTPLPDPESAQRPGHPDELALLSLSYLFALLTPIQRRELVSLHAALLREHGRYYTLRDLEPLYETLVQHLLTEAAQATIHHSKEVGDP